MSKLIAPRRKHAAMDDDYFFEEEFIFPDQGGVTGNVTVACPYCGANWELQAQPGNQQDHCDCSNCGGTFSVNWTTGEASG